jgi:YesN/AraC family two-component response regulator
MREPAPHILVVDDDASVREALAAALDRTYVVHSASNGDEACAAMRKHPIAAIILDVLLGREHGISLIERFRTLSQAPILILTGYGTEELAIRALRAKASDYLKKPVNIRELHATLTRLIQSDHSRLDPAAQARHLMTEHPERPHTTASLAKDIGLSDRQLRRRFRHVYGKTPRRYLVEARLQRAEELLRTTDLGIEQIAQAVGYQNVAAFDRTFKRAFGVTPSELRNHLNRVSGGKRPN